MVKKIFSIPMALVLLVVGGGIVWFGLYIRGNMQATIATMIPAEGRVVALETRERPGKQSTYRPIVEFVSETGQSVRFTDSTGSNPPAHRVGDTVEVLYDPATPEFAMVNSFFNIHGVSLIPLIVGGAFTLFGAVALVSGIISLIKLGVLGGVLLSRK
jgi:hypothetical protein